MIVDENGMCTLSDEDCSYHSCQVKQTNAERIRSMRDEELAEWVDRIRLYCANDSCGRSCPLVEICYSPAIEPKDTLSWLRQKSK